MYRTLVTLLIVGNVLSFILSTVDDLYHDHRIIFDIFEGITSGLFLIEI